MKSLTGLRLVKRCREAKRKCYGKNKNEYNQARREERAKGSQLCEECGHKIKHENWDAHFHYALHPNSELNVLMKGYLQRLGNLRKEGKLNDELQAEIKAEYEKQKRVLRKRLNEHFFLINLLMTNRIQNPRNRNPILIKSLIMSINC